MELWAKGGMNRDARAWTVARLSMCSYNMCPVLHWRAARMLFEKCGDFRTMHAWPVKEVNNTENCISFHFFSLASIITLLRKPLPIGSFGVCDVFHCKYPLEMKQLVALLPPFSALVACAYMRNENLR
jgi:hypothetical protein